MTHPMAYGLGAGVVRFIAGDKTAGWKALVTNVVLSMFVAIMVSFYLSDEHYSDGKKQFFILVAAFLARDLLIALMSIGSQVGKDPMGFFSRLRDAFKGSTVK